MLLKTGVMFAWAIASWALLVLWAASWPTALLLGTSLGLALAGIGFSVMHDGGHGSYSGRRWVNRVAASALDFLGGSSFVWNHKHNVLHHTYTNIEGADDDIEFHPFFRLTSGQPRYWFHRFQFFYWVPLFVFFSTKWILVDDFLALARGSVAGHPMARPRTRDWLLIVAGKLSFLLWAVVLPLLFVPVLHWLAGYVFVSTVWGLTLGVVFQLAHVVGEADSFALEEGGASPLPWVEHQLATTVDFAPRNRLLTWYVGGLNLQVEHHLFPRVGHRHYPAIAAIVRRTCADHGVTPLEHASMAGAFRAHLRHLHRMGRPSEDSGLPATAPTG